MFKNGEVDIIIHGCNCFNTMGAGIAKYIAQQFPLVKEVDLQTIKGDKSKLGTFSVANLGNEQFIINAYSQYRYYSRYSEQSDQFDYKGFPKIIEKIVADPRFQNKKIGLPLIGCGLAKGNPDKITQMIKDGFANYNGVVVVAEINNNLYKQHEKYFK